MKFLATFDLRSKTEKKNCKIFITKSDTKQKFFFQFFFAKKEKVYCPLADISRQVNATLKEKKNIILLYVFFLLRVSRTDLKKSR